MATDWKSVLLRIARAIGRGLLFLARQALVLLAGAARFTALRLAPAAWRWLRGTVFPRVHRFYLWLPHRHAVVATGLLVISIGGVLAFREILPGQADEPRSGHQQPIRAAKHQAGLVDKLLSDDWQAQKDATRSVLDSVGVVVLDDDATLPAGKRLRVIQPELLMLAMDGARKPTTSRVSLAELAQMLKDFGFPFPEGQRPAMVMEEGIRRWVGESLEDPGTPGAASARFLHAMAARQTPAIDLSSPDWVAEQYGLTHLELFVFNAAVVDVFPDGARSTTSIWAAPADLLADLVVPKAHATGFSACGLVLDLYGFGHDGSKENMQSIFGLGQSIGEMSEGAVQNLAKAASAISTLFKLHRLMLLYTSTELRVTADKAAVHKPTASEGGREVVFLATVGIDEEKQREFERKAKESPVMQGVTNCLKSLGLPTPTDVGDLAKEMETWDVSWNLYGDHATWSDKKNQFKSGNQRRAPLTPSADGAHGESRFIVDIKREEHHEGDVITDYISGKATLHTDVMPGTEAISAYAGAINAFKNGNALAGLLGLTGTTVGLAGGLMNEVLGGWAQRILDPEVSYKVAVDYHRLRYPGYSYEGEMRITRSSLESSRRRYVDPKDSNKSSEETKYRQYTGSAVARNMTTERASLTRYTDYKHDTVWSLSGQAESSASYELHNSSRSTGYRFCATRSFSSVVRKIEEIDSWGSGGNAGPITYGMSITQHAVKKGDVRIHVSLRSADLFVPYQNKTVTTQRREPCPPATYSNDVWTVGSPGGFAEATTGHSYTVSEPFPETISGSKTVTSEDGRDSITWTWNFRRIGPFEEPPANK